ncbi:hypothetical protein A3Q56_00599 [Intoshia linei]|uniref:Sulfatase N-terminal domain-containing protein n=1 Tax=Intoshia linei TaxID=1819745 RepID=A0A177BBP9_9BILA|nr:hypothetical protein A3Q56_00599 [Intoshia linei]
MSIFNIEFYLFYGNFLLNICSIQKPNIIFYLADDLGYGDLSSYGHPTQDENVIDFMANHGIKFTSMYSVATFCTPSRSAILTGIQPNRYGMNGPSQVHLPFKNFGLPRDIMTIPKHLQNNNYYTGMIGKWHLGINKYNSSDGYYLPKHYGFNYVGYNLPFTLNRLCDQENYYVSKPNNSFSFMYYADDIVEQPIDTKTLTNRLIDDAINFLYRYLDKTDKKDNFFLYFSFPQPHASIFNNDQFKYTSKRGRYGDQINEMAYAIEKVESFLKKHELYQNTLRIFSSDHGADVLLGPQGGNNGLLREKSQYVSNLKGSKSDYWDGGLRVPFIFYWPKYIKKFQIIRKPFSLLDIFPTISTIINKKNPEIKHDGKSILKKLTLNFSDLSINNNEDPILFYCHQMLIAARYKRFKFYFYNPTGTIAKLFDSMKLNNKTKNTKNENIKNFHNLNQNYIKSCSEMKKLENIKIYDVDNNPSENFAIEMDEYQKNVYLKDIDNFIKKKEKLFENVNFTLESHIVSKKFIPCCGPDCYSKTFYAKCNIN